jgi:hypothetical protein
VLGVSPFFIQIPQDWGITGGSLARHSTVANVLFRLAFLSRFAHAALDDVAFVTAGGIVDTHHQDAKRYVYAREDMICGAVLGNDDIEKAEYPRQERQKHNEHLDQGIDVADTPAERFRRILFEHAREVAVTKGRAVRSIVPAVTADKVATKNDYAEPDRNVYPEHCGRLAPQHVPAKEYRRPEKQSVEQHRLARPVH